VTHFDTTTNIRTSSPRDRSVRDRFAFLALIAGICSWVPLVIVVAAPLTAGFVTLAEAASPIAMGVGRDVTGDYANIMLGLAALMLLGAIATTRVHRTTHA